MREAFITCLFPSIMLSLAFGLGWVLGHSTIAIECERLGVFYVGKTVYECTTKGNTRPAIKD